MISPALYTQGRPAEITPDIEEFIVALYTAAPDLY